MQEQVRLEVPVSKRRRATRDKRLTCWRRRRHLRVPLHVQAPLAALVPPLAVELVEGELLCTAVEEGDERRTRWSSVLRRSAGDDAHDLAVLAKCRIDRGLVDWHRTPLILERDRERTLQAHVVSGYDQAHSEVFPGAPGSSRGRTAG